MYSVGLRCLAAVTSQRWKSLPYLRRIFAIGSVLFAANRLGTVPQVPPPHDGRSHGFARARSQQRFTRCGISWALQGGAYCFNLVKLAINDRTHVVPPSFEYDSSYWCESALMSDHMALTRIVWSFTVS
jgi:hypothetical protein